MAFKAYFYDAEGHDREIADGKVALADLSDERLLWIDVCEPTGDDLKKVAELLGLPPEILAVDDRHRSRLDNYGEFFRFAVQAAPAHSEEADEPQPRRRRRPELPQVTVESVRIEFIVAQRWLVTLRPAEVPFLRRFRSQDKAETMIGRLTGQSLAASLLDWHLGEYLEEVSAIELAVDKLDERVLRDQATRLLLGRMVALRRRVSNLRGMLVAQRDVFYGLSRPDFALVTDSGAAPFYEALVTRYERAIDEIERARSVVVGSFDLFTSRTGQQTNDLVKILTFLTAIIGFCAAIAGLMGMNFKLAFFDTGLVGFGIVTGGLALVAAVSVAYARMKRWI